MTAFDFVYYCESRILLDDSSQESKRCVNSETVIQIFLKYRCVSEKFSESLQNMIDGVYFAVNLNL